MTTTTAPVQLGNGAAKKITQLKKKDFQTPNDVRWCPGCGDYAILATFQKFLATTGRAREDVAVISGIGCSSRLPYYVETYGMHSIHGRAPAIASGLKITRPELDVYVITGDGDALSIGGNHTLHVLRRNVDLNILLLNNRIYGLTKGQYSPASEQGKVTKSSPWGSIEPAVNPAAFAIGAGATFYARVVDVDVKHMMEIFAAARAHKGTSYIEILQNCVVFNDGAFHEVEDKKTAKQHKLVLKDGEPLLYDDGKKGITRDPKTGHAVSIDLEAEPGRKEEVLIHHEADETGGLAAMYASMDASLPVPVGVFRAVKRTVYDQAVVEQGAHAREVRGEGNLEALLHSGDVWTVK